MCSKQAAFLSDSWGVSRKVKTAAKERREIFGPDGKGKYSVTVHTEPK